MMVDTGGLVMAVDTDVDVTATELALDADGARGNVTDQSTPETVKTSGNRSTGNKTNGRIRCR